MRFPGDATYRDFWMKQRKWDWDPIAAYKAGLHSGTTALQEPQLPHLNLETDPLLEWGRAQEQFASNQAVDKPAPEQQVMAPAFEPLRPVDRFHERYTEPFRDPYSTIPGSFGPMGPGR